MIQTNDETIQTNDETIQTNNETIPIDDGHPLCPFHYNPELGMSIMKKTLQDVLPDDSCLKGAVYPFELLSIFEDEMDKQIRSTIYKVMDSFWENYPKTYPTVVCQISSCFSNYFGIDICSGKGWNIIGNILSPKVEQTLSRTRIEKIIEKLYTVFQKTSCIEQFVPHSLVELERLLKYEDQCFSMESDLRYDFYLHQLRYPGTLIHYMQKRLTFRSKIWRHRKIVSVVQQDLMRDSKIPPIDDVLCAHRLLKDFHNDKLPLSNRSKQMLQINENNEYTNNEIDMFSAYTPFYDFEKYQCIGINNPFHPEYPKLYQHDGHEFPNMMYILHYEIFKLFVSKSEAFHLCFSFHMKHEWEMFLQRLLQEKFYTNCYEAMENIDMRIALLESKEFKTQEYFPSIISSSFIDSVYKEIRNEMILSLPCENKIEFETIIRCLQKWFIIWKDNLGELALISFFFHLFFGIENVESSSEKNYFPDRLISISFERIESHQKVQELFQKISFPIINTDIKFEHVLKCFQKYAFFQKKNITHAQNKIDLFHDLFKKLYKFFDIKPEPIPEYETCASITDWEQYLFFSQIIKN